MRPYKRPRDGDIPQEKRVIKAKPDFPGIPSYGRDVRERVDEVMDGESPDTLERNPSVLGRIRRAARDMGYTVKKNQPADFVELWKAGLSIRLKLGADGSINLVEMHSAGEHEDTVVLSWHNGEFIYPNENTEHSLLIVSDDDDEETLRGKRHHLEKIKFAKELLEELLNY